MNHVLLAMSRWQAISRVSWDLSQTRTCEAPSNDFTHTVRDMENICGPPVFKIKVKSLKIHHITNLIVSMKDLIELAGFTDTISW